MVNISSIVETVGGTGLKAVNLIPNSTLTEDAVTITAPVNIAQWAVFIIIIYIAWKILFRR